MKNSFIRSIPSTVLIVILSLPLCTTSPARQDTEITLAKQQPGSWSSPENFILRFSPTSIASFLQTFFNARSYPQEHLACNFGHVVQGIRLAPHHVHPRKFIKKVLNLFSLKLHDLYVNPYAFKSFVEKLVLYTATYADKEREKEILVTSFVDSIGTTLHDRFDELRDEPDKMLRQLALHLYELCVADGQDISVRELQHAIHYFLTKGMSLLVWSPVDQEDAWNILVALADQVTACVAHNLIDQEMADDLYWLLIKQFSIFLSVAAHELNESFFEVASKALKENEGFWNAEERELYITSKATSLKNAFLEAESVSRLRALGYHTN